MNETEYLLITLMEECDEVSQRISKALRFGLDEAQPGFPDNETRIVEEICDLRGVVSMLQAHKILNKLLDIEYVNARLRVKKEKLSKYMEYSRERGTLE